MVRKQHLDICGRLQHGAGKKIFEETILLFSL